MQLGDRAHQAVALFQQLALAGGEAGGDLEDLAAHRSLAAVQLCLAEVEGDVVLE